MMDAMQAFLQANALTPPAFAPTSRYYGIETAQRVEANGRTVVFVRRRFLPPAENFALLQTYTVVAGDRLDNLAYRALGDPEQSWRLCDANGAMRPETLVVDVGRALRITVPEGVPGTPGPG